MPLSMELISGTPVYQTVNISVGTKGSLEWDEKTSYNQEPSSGWAQAVHCMDLGEDPRHAVSVGTGEQT